MKIRKAEQTDFEEIQRLNKALFDFEEQFKHGYNVNWPYEESGIKYFKKRLNNENSIALIAKEEIRAVGYIIAFIDNYPYREPNPLCEIENMFVEEQYRSKGIGRILIDSVRKEAKMRNVKRLRVGAIAQNHQAINFYKAQGFKDTNLYLEEEL